MAAANFLRDVLEMFYGPISNEEKQRFSATISPSKKQFQAMASCVENAGYEG